LAGRGNKAQTKQCTASHRLGAVTTGAIKQGYKHQLASRRELVDKNPR